MAGTEVPGEEAMVFFERTLIDSLGCGGRHSTAMAGGETAIHCSAGDISEQMNVGGKSIIDGRKGGGEKTEVGQHVK